MNHIHMVRSSALQPSVYYLFSFYGSAHLCFCIRNAFNLPRMMNDPRFLRSAPQQAALLQRHA